MMDYRLTWFLFGCVVGLVIGYTFRSLRELKQKVDDVEKRVSDKPSDSGFTTPEWLKNVALLLVVLLTAYAAFSSQRSSTDVKHQQNESDKAVSCIQDYLATTIIALNARTKYNIGQSAANVDLQKAQAVFLAGLHQSGQTPVLDLAALTKYLNALDVYLTIATKANAQVASNPYPTNTAFTDCLKK